MKHDPRTRTLSACGLIAVVAFGLYATETVRPPGCDASFGAFVNGEGEPWPVNGEEATWDELEDQAYRDLVASGECEPPAARWRHWLG